MSLKDEVRGGKKPWYRHRVADALGPAEDAELDDALADPNVTLHVLWRYLAARGIDVSYRALQIWREKAQREPC